MHCLLAYRVFQPNLNLCGTLVHLNADAQNFHAVGACSLSVRGG